MPISTDPGILAAAREGIEVLLQFKGQPIVLMRKGLPIAKPGGGHDFGDAQPLMAQTFAVSQVGDDIVEDGDSGDTQVIKRNYALTARYDADIAPDDTFSTAEADFRVENVNASSGFKTHADVVGFVKVP
jgi:hypothetical protein